MENMKLTLLKFRMIYKNLQWLHLWFGKFTPLEDEVYPCLKNHWLMQKRLL